MYNVMPCTSPAPSLSHMYSAPPHLLPLPHPSPRNNIWLKKNPWFGEQVIPALQQSVIRILSRLKLLI